MIAVTDCLMLQEYDDARQKFDDKKKERKIVEKQMRDLKRLHAPLRLKLQENEAIVKRFRDSERVSCVVVVYIAGREYSMKIRYNIIQ